MSNVVSTQIVDKNGKQTTVKKKIGEVPKPFARPIPSPLAKKPEISDEQRNQEAVRDLFTRLSIKSSGNVKIKELSRGIYAVSDGSSKQVAFDAVQVGDEVVSGVIEKNTAGVTGKLHIGLGVSNHTHTNGYALPSLEASVETQLDAAQIALPHLT